MKIIMMAFGSRGDIQPFLALAVALRERGHQVTLTVPDDFEAQCRAYNIPHIRIPLSVKTFLETDLGKRITQEGITPSTLMGLWREMIPEIRRALFATTEIVAEQARDADLLISHGFLAPFAFTIHQHIQIPLMFGIAAPIIATKQFPCPTFPPMPIGEQFYNPFTYRLLVRLVISFMIAPMNDFRKQVGLPTRSAGQIIDVLFSGDFPVMMHYSRHLQPAPTDWHENIRVMGTWALPALPDWIPPQKLTEFLAQGEPPIFIGFGSMPVPNPPRTAHYISEALRKANLRGVLQAGWGGLDYEDEHLITIGDAPHDWLFPQMSAIVHHGGSGTTQSALMAGKPALIVPFSADQPFWGKRIAELGVGVPPIRPRRITPERLAAALRILTQDKAMRQRAAEFGALFQAENGLAATCDLVERYIH